MEVDNPKLKIETVKSTVGEHANVNIQYLKIDHLHNYCLYTNSDTQCVKFLKVLDMICTKFD